MYIELKKLNVSVLSPLQYLQYLFCHINYVKCTIRLHVWSLERSHPIRCTHVDLFVLSVVCGTLTG